MPMLMAERRKGFMATTLKEDNQNERQCNRNTRSDSHPDC